jgi:DNA repair protein RadD
MFGRGLRSAPAKVDLLVFDHGGSTLRLGWPTDIGQDWLDDGRAKTFAARHINAKSEPLPRLCGECKAIVPRHLNVCGSCGAPIRAKSEVQTLDGELVEFGARRSGKSVLSTADKAAFYGELSWIARDKGYASGWAAHIYREKFRVWPNDEIKRTTSLRAPSLKTLGWLTSRRIAYAKTRGRPHG